MTATAGFVTFLALTVVALILVVLTGMKGRRKPHFVCVGVTLVLLGVTIYYAEMLGDEYDLESAGRITPIHLALAKLTVGAYLLPAISGALTIRDLRWRSLHGKLALLVLLLTGATFVTGLVMILSSEPLVPA